MFFPKKVSNPNSCAIARPANASAPQDYNAISDSALSALTSALTACRITSAGNRPKQPGMMSGSVAGYGA